MRGASGDLEGQSMYLYDNLGSPLTIVTQSNTTTDAWAYDPYGVAELTEQSVAQAYTPFAFTGGLNDRVTGWTLNGARYYDAGEGRWTQMDTLDAPLDPYNANRYAYAANNPVNYVDPTGRAITWKGVAGAVGGVIGTGIAAFLVGGACATGIGCLALGAAAGAVGGGLGSGLGTGIAGGSPSEIGESAAYGAIGGAGGGLLAGAGRAGYLMKYGRL